MVKIQDFNPFLFPSSFPPDASESTPQSPAYASRSTSSPNSPYQSCSSTRGPPPSQSSSFHPHPEDSYGPCAACKINGRQCSDPCYLASYLPSDEVHKFAVADTVFGWGHLDNFLQIQKNKNSSNYIPLLVLLKDTSQDEEVQSNPKNSESMDIDNQLVKLPSTSYNVSPRNDLQLNPYDGSMFGHNDTVLDFKHQICFPTLTESFVQVPRNRTTKKVKKVMLGDKITALQQLVSPFGKTNRASIFLESIQYILFLHEQVTVSLNTCGIRLQLLSNPYLKHGAPITHPQSCNGKSHDRDKQSHDLRSRGLCLVPLGCVFLPEHL